MWNLSSDDIERAREELKGRRAAIQARYEEELKALDADLANVETLDRAADVFRARHQPPEEAAVAELTPAATPAWPAAEETAEVSAAPAWRAPRNKTAAEEPAPETETASPPPRGSSRWRMHIASRPEGAEQV